MWSAPSSPLQPELRSPESRQLKCNNVRCKHREPIQVSLGRTVDNIDVHAIDVPKLLQALHKSTQRRILFFCDGGENCDGWTSERRPLPAPRVAMRPTSQQCR